MVKISLSYVCLSNSLMVGEVQNCLPIHNAWYTGTLVRKLLVPGAAGLGVTQLTEETTKIAPSQLKTSTMTSGSSHDSLKEYESAHTVLVSGASGFIGSFLCEQLEKAGYSVVKLDIRDATNPCDLTDVTAVENWFKLTKNKYHDAFALINCVGIPDVAGGQSITDITDVSSETFLTHLKVNLESVFTLMREFVRYYRSSAQHIINMSSLYSVVAPRLDLYDGHIKHPGYIASKTGLVGLSKYCAVLCAKDNIKVNCIAPGAVAETTGVQGDFLEKYKLNVPLHRPIPLQECANAVIFLLSTKNVTGSNLVIDGGYSLW